MLPLNNTAVVALRAVLRIPFGHGRFSWTRASVALLIDTLNLPEREGQGTYDVYRLRSEVVVLWLARRNAQYPLDKRDTCGSASLGSRLEFIRCLVGIRI